MDRRKVRVLKLIAFDRFRKASGYTRTPIKTGNHETTVPPFVRVRTREKHGKGRRNYYNNQKEVLLL